MFYKKEGKLQYSLNKLKILFEKINKIDFLDRPRKEKKQDLEDLNKYIFSFYKLLTTQHKYLELFCSKLEEQKCEIKIYKKNKLLSDAVNGEILSPESNFKMIVKDHLEENIGKKVIATDCQTICSSEILHETTKENDVFNLEIINNKILINLNKLFLQWKGGRRYIVRRLQKNMFRR